MFKSKPYEIVLKGASADKEEYGAFDDLSLYPKVRQWFEGCKRVDVCGIAGDYCVKESTERLLRYVDASKVGILPDCIRSIDDGSTLETFVAEKGLEIIR